MTTGLLLHVMSLLAVLSPAYIMCRRYITSMRRMRSCKCLRCGYPKRSITSLCPECGSDCVARQRAVSMRLLGYQVVGLLAMLAIESVLIPWATGKRLQYWPTKMLVIANGMHATRSTWEEIATRLNSDQWPASISGSECDMLRQLDLQLRTTYSSKDPVAMSGAMKVLSLAMQQYRAEQIISEWEGGTVASPQTSKSLLGHLIVNNLQSHEIAALMWNDVFWNSVTEQNQEATCAVLFRRLDSEDRCGVVLYALDNAFGGANQNSAPLTVIARAIGYPDCDRFLREGASFDFAADRISVDAISDWLDLFIDEQDANLSSIDRGLVLWAAGLMGWEDHQLALACRTAIYSDEQEFMYGGLAAAGEVDESELASLIDVVARVAGDEQVMHDVVVRRMILGLLRSYALYNAEARWDLLRLAQPGNLVQELWIGVALHDCGIREGRILLNAVMHSGGKEADIAAEVVRSGN